MCTCDDVSDPSCSEDVLLDPLFMELLLVPLICIEVVDSFWGEVKPGALDLRIYGLIINPSTLLSKTK